MKNSALYNEAISKIDAANSEDPNLESFEGRTFPKEFLYSNRMTRWLDKLDPNASEVIRLAVRGQHIRRWKIPRNQFPTGREGYLKWRESLKDFHANETGNILKEIGYTKEFIDRVRALIKKKKIKSNPEAQLLEDVACLVFLESYLPEFSKKHEEGKIVHILKRTWNKMSASGRKAVLTIKLEPELKRIIGNAIDLKSNPLE